MADKEDEKKKRIQEEQKVDDDDDVDSEDDDEDEEDEDEDQEPQLKYIRLSQDITKILDKDCATCLAVHEKFLALGTHDGKVYVLDYHGNVVKGFNSHGTRVNELSIDNSGDYIASCSDDGKVTLHAWTIGEVQSFHYSRPVFSVAIDPEYGKNNSQRFCSGGRDKKLVLNTKRWYGHTDKIIHSGEGPIYAIKWSGSLIAWGNDLGVKIYDCDSEQRITYIDRPKNSPSADKCRCNLCWDGKDIIIIGWGHVIKIGQIKEKNDPITGTTKYVELIHMFSLDEAFICGIAPFDDKLVILTYLEDDSPPNSPQLNSKHQKNQNKEDEDEEQELPELRILDRHGVEISNESLSLVDSTRRTALDHRLAYYANDNQYFLISQKDIVMARPRELSDHLEWELAHERFQKAYEKAKENSHRLKENDLVIIGEQYLSHLILQGQAEKAAALCPEIAKDNIKRWEKWIFWFAKTSQLKAIVKYIPTSQPKLTPAVYEIVLKHFLKNEPGKFLDTLRVWPSSLYNMETIIVYVNAEIKSFPQNEVPKQINEALALLYTYNCQYDKALNILLRHKIPEPFELIEKRNLYESVKKDKILLLMEYNQQKAVELLVNNSEKIDVDTVVDQLQHHPQNLYVYLNALLAKNPQLGTKYHEKQVELLAEYNPKTLMDFLKISSYYPLEKASKICEQKGLYEEKVFILGRMGNTKDALALLMEKVPDVKKAIEFVKQNNDDELWESLISRSIHDPNFVSELLENIGGHVDPIRLLKIIPNTMKIPNLRDKLVKILSDYNLQMSLREGCNEVLKADCVHLLNNFVRISKSSIRVDESTTCANCGEMILHSDNVVIFWCNHAFHHRCQSQVPSNLPGGGVGVGVVGGVGGPQSNNNNSNNNNPLVGITGPIGSPNIPNLNNANNLGLNTSSLNSMSLSPMNQDYSGMRSKNSMGGSFRQSAQFCTICVDSRKKKLH